MSKLHDRNSAKLNKYCEDEGITSMALLVYTESRPDIPDFIFNLKSHTHPEKGPRRLYHLARVVKLDPPGPTGVESGVAELVAITATCTKFGSNKYLEPPPPEVKRVRFHRRNLLFLGESARKADLQYLLAANRFGMDALYCYIKPVADSTAEAEITHEVSLFRKHFFYT